MFYRMHTDGVQVPVALENIYAGPDATACWIIGGGPSLALLNHSEIVSSPAPKFGVNLSGSGLIRPTFWTSYDPTARFHRSIYLDASIVKFLHRCRATDLVPETSHKVADSPATFFFDRNQQTGFHNFPNPLGQGVTDWQDSLIQAIDIAYRLGFRELYLTGTELEIRPSDPLLKLAQQKGIAHTPHELLGEFIKRCEAAGISRDEITKIGIGQQYHFDESKSLSAAIQTDFHYFRVAQYLRLARRSLSQVGLQLFVIGHTGRLSSIFPSLTVSEAINRIHKRVGNPTSESTRGLYTHQRKRELPDLPPMKDFRPHNWPSASRSVQQQKPNNQRPPSAVDQKHPRVNGWELLKEIPIDLNEQG